MGVIKRTFFNGIRHVSFYIHTLNVISLNALTLLYELQFLNFHNTF